MQQLTIFDWLPDLQEEPAVGEYVAKHGANICHIMRPSYIGRKVVYECSTHSRECFRVGVLEAYIPYEETYRSIIYVGEKQRILLTHRDGKDIYECLPWHSYKKRNDRITRVRR